MVLLGIFYNFLYPGIPLRAFDTDALDPLRISLESFGNRMNPI
jgi:hypothetical protein